MHALNVVVHRVGERREENKEDTLELRI